MRSLANFNDCLRYSLSPLERVLLSSINRCNDSRNKCLDELVLETLHEGSMMAQEIVLTNNKTLTFNLSICKSFNADFDGDEIVFVSNRWLPILLSKKQFRINSVTYSLTRVYNHLVVFPKTARQPNCGKSLKA